MNKQNNNYSNENNELRIQGNNIQPKIEKIFQNQRADFSFEEILDQPLDENLKIEISILYNLLRIQLKDNPAISRFKYPIKLVKGIVKLVVKHKINVQTVYKIFRGAIEIRNIYRWVKRYRGIVRDEEGMNRLKKIKTNEKIENTIENEEMNQNNFETNDMNENDEELCEFKNEEMEDEFNYEREQKEEEIQNCDDQFEIPIINSQQSFKSRKQNTRSQIRQQEQKKFRKEMIIKKVIKNDNLSLKTQQENQKFSIQDQDKSEQTLENMIKKCSDNVYIKHQKELLEQQNHMFKEFLDQQNLLLQKFLDEQNKTMQTIVELLKTNVRKN